MVKIAICDDETEFLDLLSDSLDSWCRAHQLTLQLYRFTNGDELISAHRAVGDELLTQKLHNDPSEKSVQRESIRCRIR